MVTHTRQVSYTAAADEHDGVFLQVVSDSRNVDGCFQTVGQTDSRDLSHCGVRLLRAGGGDLRANASLLGCRLVDCRVLQGVEALLKHRCFGLVVLLTATLSDKLVKGWHDNFPPSSEFNVYTDTRPQSDELSE